MRNAAAGTLSRLVLIVVVATLLGRLVSLASPAGQGSGPDGGPWAGFLGAVSYPVRRVLADLVWVRADRYQHDGIRELGADGTVRVRPISNRELAPFLTWVIQLDPHFIEAYSTVVEYWLYELGRHHEGQALLRRGIEENRLDPRVKELMVQWAVYRLVHEKDAAGARELLEQAHAIQMIHGARAEQVRFVYGPAVVRGLLVLACYRMGDKAAARSWMTLGHSLREDHPYVQELRQLEGSATSRVAPPATPASEGTTAAGLRSQSGPPAGTHDHPPGTDCSTEHTGQGSVGPTGVTSTGDGVVPGQQVSLPPWIDPLVRSRLQSQITLWVVILGGMKLCRHRALAAVIAAALSTCGGAQADKPSQLPLLVRHDLVDYFLAFIAVVGVVLVVALHLLLRRARTPGLTGQDKLLQMLDTLVASDPTPDRSLEVAALCCDNRLFEKALAYVDRITAPEGDLAVRAQALRIVALLGLARMEEAGSLWSGIDPGRFSPQDQYRVAVAWKEHGLLSRAKDAFLRIFLTDIGFADVSQQLAEISAGEAAGRQADGLEPTRRLVAGRYRDLALISRNSEETVCSAYDKDLERSVRLHLMNPDGAGAQEVQVFLDRAAALSRVDHPNVLKLYDVQKAKLPFYSVEDFSGPSLEDWIATGPTLEDRMRAARSVLELARDLEGAGSSVNGLSQADLIVGPGAAVKVVRFPSQLARSAAPWPSPELIKRILDFKETGRDQSAMAAGVVWALASSDVSHGDAIGRALERLDSMVKVLELTQQDRDDHWLVTALVWLEDLHRARIHGLKSKFAVSQRYRDQPDKLVRAFFRDANLEEVGTLLDDMVKRIKDHDGDGRPPPGPVLDLVTQLADLDVARIKADLTRLTTDASIPDPERVLTLDRLYELFGDLSVRIARVVEAHEVDLVRVVEAATRSSPYASQIQTQSDGSRRQVRASRPGEFRERLGATLRDLIANAFEAHSSHLSVTVGPGEAPGDVGVHRIALVDDGDGVPEDLMQQLGTGRPSSKPAGTATGLSAARELMLRHGGRLDVRPRTGSRGTEVVLWFPG